MARCKAYLLKNARYAVHEVGEVCVTAQDRLTGAHRSRFSLIRFAHGESGNTIRAANLQKGRVSRRHRTRDHDRPFSVIEQG
jgi:hypothetical protein